MRALRPSALALVGLLTALGGCAEAPSWDLVRAGVRRSFPDVPQVTADTLAAWQARGVPVVLLDVRAPDEFAVSHLRGARRVDPEAPAFAVLPALRALPAGTKVVAYCSVGYRSSALAERLRAGGVAVTNLDGSLFRWANEGREVVRGERAVRAVHPYDRVWGTLLRRDLRRSDGAD